MTVPPAALLAYERLRARVINSQPYSEGFAAIVYHGMVRGLTVMLTEPTPNLTSPPPRVGPLEAGPINRELLRLIANMVLQSQSEVMHVY